MSVIEGVDCARWTVNDPLQLVVSCQSPGNIAGTIYIKRPPLFISARRTFIDYELIFFRDGVE